MEVGDVSLVASSGAVLSMSEKAALQSSVPLLKKQYRFGSVKLFGKIRGKTSDYLIAICEESTGIKKYFFRCAQCCRMVTFAAFSIQRGGLSSHPAVSLWSTEAHLHLPACLC
jgi:hypothetical protein